MAATTDIVLHSKEAPGPRPEDEQTGLPYIDALSPQEEAHVKALIDQEVDLLLTQCTAACFALHCNLSCSQVHFQYITV